MTLASGGSPMIPLVVSPQNQGWQCGAYEGAVEEMMCVVCACVTEGA